MTEQPQIPASVPSAVEAQPAPVAAAPAPEAPRVVLEDGNDVTDGIEPEEEKKPRMKRRDLLAVSALLRRNKLDPTDAQAMGLGILYLQEKRAGETKVSFQEWLDEDMPEDEDGDDEDGFDEDGNPTQP